MPRPNILYIHSHDTGRYIQPYGHAVPTPNLQRLAEGGVLFRQCFCAAPTCSPSRAALLTGQSAHSAGMIGLTNRGFAAHDLSQHLVNTLRGAGYRGVLSGLQHVSSDANEIGYDEILPARRWWRGEGDGPAEAAVKFIEAAPQEPFMLTVGFAQTHRKFPEPGDEEDERYCAPPAPLPDTPRTRYDMARFQTSARQLDDQMGLVFDALERTGLAENTLVIATTDHGIAFPSMKCNLTAHGAGVMLIMRGPGGFTGGRVCDALVSHVDVFPTLCDLLEIEPPAWLEGRSMMPLVRGEADEVNEAVFSEVTYHALYEPQRAVRTKRYSYIRRYADRPTPFMADCDDSPSKDEWLEAGWRKRRVDKEQLYDLTFDPNEACNRIDDPELAGVLADLRARLDRWMEETDDPLLAGPVPAPSGAQVNPDDEDSPSGELIEIP